MQTNPTKLLQTNDCNLHYTCTMMPCGALSAPLLWSFGAATMYSALPTYNIILCISQIIQIPKRVSVTFGVHRVCHAAFTTIYTKQTLQPGLINKCILSHFNAPPRTAKSLWWLLLFLWCNFGSIVCRVAVLYKYSWYSRAVIIFGGFGDTFAVCEL